MEFIYNAGFTTNKQQTNKQKQKTKQNEYTIILGPFIRRSFLV